MRSSSVALVDKASSDNQPLYYIQELQDKQRESFLSALNSQDLADVTFKIGKEGNEYRVNRTLLALISPVFKAMLFGTMKEAQPDSVVIIKDMLPAVFGCIVKFAYCNDSRITLKTLFPLITACDRYQIKSLLDGCHHLLEYALNVDNLLMCLQSVIVELKRDGECMKIMENYIEKNDPIGHLILKSDNVCQFFDFLLSWNNGLDAVTGDAHLSDVIKLCEAYLDAATNHDAKAILTKEGFWSMSKLGVRGLLMRSIQCNEETIWETLLTWARLNVPLCADDPVNKKFRICLQSVRDLIRFGLMDGRYFSENVIPMNVLSDKEVIDVL